MKDLLPCLIWADDGKSFYTLETTGIVRRVGADDLSVLQKVEIGSMCTWMTMSGAGLLVADSGAQQIAVLDPGTLETKKRIAVPSVDRIASSPKLQVSLRSIQRRRPSSRAVDLTAGRIVKQYTRPDPAVRRLRSVQISVASPDGKYLFAARGNRGPFSLPHIEGTNLIQDLNSPRIAAQAHTVEVSPDSKFVCLLSGSGNGPGYATSVLQRRGPVRAPTVVVKGGAFPRAVGFDPKKGLIFTQSHDKNLIVFDSAWIIRLKDYSLPRERETQEDRRPVGERHVALVHGNAPLSREAEVAGASTGRLGLSFDFRIAPGAHLQTHLRRSRRARELPQSLDRYRRRQQNARIVDDTRPVAA